MSGVKSVSRHKEASAGGGSFAPQGGSFAPQGGLIARQNLAIRVSRTTCLTIRTNLSSGWFYQDHRWSLINESVVLIKRICGPTLTTVSIVRLIITTNTSFEFFISLGSWFLAYGKSSKIHQKLLML